MDAHKDSIKVAAFFPERPEPVEWTETTTVEAIRRLARKLQREAPEEVHCCYEAGPTGYALQRQLRAAGIGCTVIAPSLTPVKPGVRIKTDRRDARKLAELFRAGLLTEVHPPSETDEALRDLCRCRDEGTHAERGSGWTCCGPASRWPGCAASAASTRSPRFAWWPSFTTSAASARPGN
jgi:transposase